MDKREIIEKLLATLRTPEVRSKEEVWNAINDGVLSAESNQDSRFRLIKLWPLAAAASVIIAVMVLLPSSNKTEFSNNTNAIQTIELADGSKVRLSPFSKLSFEMAESRRKAFLNGEAFFEIEKGNKFSVVTPEGVVDVLGTSFHVDARSEELDVKCYTGKVQVKYDGTSVSLTMGDAVSSVKSVGRYSHDLERKFGDDKSLNFESQLLNSVITDLNIFRNMELKNVSELNPAITVEFQNESSDDIVSLLAKISGLSYKKVGEGSYELY